MKNEKFCLIKIANYIGPFDLLVELIEKNNLDINRIALAQIADQYLIYLGNNKVKILELANFLEIASKLALIKSLSLIPLSRVSAEEEEEVQEFESRVAVYAKFREISKLMEKMYAKRAFFSRESFPNIRNRVVEYKGEVPSGLLEASFAGILKRLGDSCILKKEKLFLKLEMKDIMKLINSKLQFKKKLSFLKIARKMNRMQSVLAFLIILELTRQAKARIIQKGFLQDIFVHNISK